MALTHLLDTSVLKRLGHAAMREKVERLAFAGTLGRPGICDLEVGFSARNAPEWDDLLVALGAFEPVPTTESHVRRALQVQRILAARSQRGRKIPDLLVAAAAEELGVIVLHYDADFDLISAATGQRTEWIAPAGTID
ncbi:MAG: VapC toxin family PIN domain ribonuclease [Actinobacteria bacterium 69-20]|nr:PIN domain nuclease [Actinomycetota bacterium]OJV26544.1 MAG: VapC toxin family PIN domain ribonuclease [Actinobacteria bacterium 69-20]